MKFLFLILFSASAFAQYSAPIEQRAMTTLVVQKAGLSDEELNSIRAHLQPATHLVWVNRDKNTHSREHIILIGNEVGVYMPLTLEAIYQYRTRGKPRVDVVLSHQSSFQMQTPISLGTDVHLFGLPLFIGGKANLTEMNPPWDPYYDRYWDEVFSVSAEIGTRGFFTSKQRLMGSVQVGSTWIISKLYDTPHAYFLQVGLAYRIFKR